MKFFNFLKKKRNTPVFTSALHGTKTLQASFNGALTDYHYVYSITAESKHELDKAVWDKLMLEVQTFKLHHRITKEFTETKLVWFWK